MATETVLDIVAILRQCRLCGQWKPLDHFLRLNRHQQVVGNERVCVACRRHRYAGEGNKIARSVERRQVQPRQTARIPS